MESAKGSPGDERCIEERLERIEQQLGSLKPKSKDAWEKFGSISSFVSAMFAIGVSVFVTGRIENALKERQLQLSNVTEMQGLLSKLVDGATPVEGARASSLTMAAFGRYAVAPLIQVMQTCPSNIAVAMDGLRAAGATEPEVVCSQLEAVIENRTRLYNFEVHESAAQLLGDLNCQTAAAGLRSYAERLARASVKEAPFTSVQGSQGLSEENLETVRTKAKDALLALDARRGT